MRRDQVDFSQVELKHAEIHVRLENWGAWCHSRGGESTSPMFRLFRSTDHWHSPATPSAPASDPIDAQRIAKGVAALPEPHRVALSWCYVKRTTPRQACQELATTMHGVWLYIRDGRQMLVNRGV